MEQMKRFARTDECYSRFIMSCLDDHTAHDCGCCANCLGKELLPSRVSACYIEKAAEYIDGLMIPIEPRKMWIKSVVTELRKMQHVNREGICLSKYGDAGYGELVKRRKYSRYRRFCDELVGKSARTLRPLMNECGITHICCVPSLRSDIVADFAVRLAETLGLQYAELLTKANARQQKEMKNSAIQCANAYLSFSVIEGAEMPEKVLLVDDIVDSRWTLTVCGYRLMEAGCAEVYPFALADSSQTMEVT